MAFTTSGQETEWALFLQPRSPHRASVLWTTLQFVGLAHYTLSYMLCWPCDLDHDLWPLTAHALYAQLCGHNVSTKFANSNPLIRCGALELWGLMTLELLTRKQHRKLQQVNQTATTDRHQRWAVYKTYKELLERMMQKIKTKIKLMPPTSCCQWQLKLPVPGTSLP